MSLKAYGQAMVVSNPFSVGHLLYNALFSERGVSFKVILLSTHNIVLCPCFTVFVGFREIDERRNV